MKLLFFGYVNVREKYVKKAGFHTEKYGLLRKSTPLIRVYGFTRTQYVLCTYFQNHHKIIKLLTSLPKLYAVLKFGSTNFLWISCWEMLSQPLCSNLDISPTLFREKPPPDPFCHGVTVKCSQHLERTSRSAFNFEFLFYSMLLGQHGSLREHDTGSQTVRER